MKDHVAAYIRQEQAAYQQAARDNPRVASRRFPVSKQNIWYRRINRLTDWHLSRGLDIPAALLRPYHAPVMQRFKSGIPLKYQFRGLNALRELSRANVLFSDVLASTPPLDILDLSAGGCGIAEVFGYYGHTVTSRDYYGNNDRNDAGHSYAEIHNELGLTCKNFNGRERPYEFASGSFDLVLSYQAIDAYGDVSDWYDVVDEMLRISRKSIGLVLNPPAQKSPENIAAAAAFELNMQNTHSTLTGTCPETGLTALRIDKN